MTIFLLPLMLFAGLGLLACLSIHLIALTGHLSWLQGFLSEENQTLASMVMVGGIFVVWLPAVLIAQRINNGNRLNFSWKKVLAGCPQWMVYAAYTMFGYAILSFLLIVTSGDIDDARGVRVFSGHAMMFYGLAFCIFFSSWNLPRLLRTHRCPAGHEVSHEDKFCPLCGLPTAQSGQDGL